MKWQQCYQVAPLLNFKQETTVWVVVGVSERSIGRKINHNLGLGYLVCSLDCDLSLSLSLS